MLKLLGGHHNHGSRFFLIFTDTYFFFLITLMCVSVSCTVFVLNVAGKTYPVNPRVLKITDFMERVLRVNSKRGMQNKHPSNLCAISATGKNNMRETSCVQQYHKTEENVSQIGNCNCNVQSNTRSEDSSAEWKRVAGVLDRVLLITLFLCAFITASAFAIKLYIETNMSGMDDANAVELIPSHQRTSHG